MKIYETKTETFTREVCIKTTCDLCGQDVDTPYEPNDTLSMDVSDTVTVVYRRRVPKPIVFFHDFEESEQVVLVREKSWNCPDGGWGTQTEVDICPRCFMEKLVPWLKSQGVKVEERKWDW